MVAHGRSMVYGLRLCIYTYIYMYRYVTSIYAFFIVGRGCVFDV